MMLWGKGMAETEKCNIRPKLENSAIVGAAVYSLNSEQGRNSSNFGVPGFEAVKESRVLTVFICLDDWRPRWMQKRIQLRKKRSSDVFR